MKKNSSSNKPRASKAVKATPAKKTAAKKAPAKGPKIPATGTLAARLAAVKKIEAMDRPAAASQARAVPRLAVAKAPAARPQRNSDFPNTYIAEISVRLEDPDHPVTLKWTGPQAGAQEKGPFRSSPGAGLRGLNCDNVTTSRRSGSTCTPKGTFTVTGIAPRLNSHPEATNVTWFVPARGIALHYYPSVPKFAASHGCVRIALRRVAQLIQNNSRVGVTKVIVDGTWTKPARQW